MVISIRILAALAALSAFSCASDGRNGASQLDKARELFVTVEWVGVQTRPPLEIAIATETLSGEMASWQARSPGFRTGMIVGYEDVTRILEVLSVGDFVMRRVVAEPDFRIQQYILRVRMTNDARVFALGCDQVTEILLKRLQAALPEKSASIMQSLLDNIEPKK